MQQIQNNNEHNQKHSEPYRVITPPELEYGQSRSHRKTQLQSAKFQAQHECHAGIEVSPVPLATASVPAAVAVAGF